ncbi:MAG: single-stranded DNA-binding protein [Caldilineaceae bacterium]
MYQQITLIGNLGTDPEMRYTQSGVPVTTFSLAVTRRWSGQDGQRQEKTIWFRVTAWRKLAEFSSQYLTKGRQVLVVGEMEEPRVWTDSRSGEARAGLDVTANTIQFVGSKPDGAAVSAPASSAPTGTDAGTMHDEDIPF